MATLTNLEWDILFRLSMNEDIKSSDRPRDQARTRLKRLGLIIFDRSSWRWQLTHAGQDMTSDFPRGTWE